MMLIAESGSTKTSWVLMDKNTGQFSFKTGGFNPYTQTSAQIQQRIKKEVMPNLEGRVVDQLFFYGAGCSTENNKAMMYNAFHTFLKDTHIEIAHDLLAAARSLWFRDSGVVAIAGTGSNSCIYDGQKIIKAVPSVGYILGDEGSGAHMGKILVKDFLYGNMPEHLEKAFQQEYKYNADIILNKVYKEENPNRWLASFSPYIHQNIEEPYYHGLVYDNVRSLFEAYIRHYKAYQSLPLGLVGSVAYYYRSFFENVATEYGFTIKKVIKSPIDELVKYHQA